MKRRLLICLMFLASQGMLLSQWVSQASGFTAPFRGIAHIWAVSEQIAWGVAYDGSGTGTVIQEFTRTSNGGAAWIPGSVTGAENLSPSMIFALNADTAWIAFHHAVASGGKIMRTNNGGLNWAHQATALWPDSADAYPNLIYFWNENEGFCMGDPTYGYFELYTTQNGGNIWTRVDSSHIPAIIAGEYGYEGRFSVIGNTVLFGTNKGRIFKSNDKGYTWSVIMTPLAASNGRVRVVEFRDTQNGLIADRVNNAYVMHETTNGGQSWQPITPTGVVYGNDLRYIKGTPSTYVSSGSHTALSGASISYDGGYTWTDISIVTNTQYTALAFPNNLTGWAGQFNQSSTQGGIVKFVGSTIGLPSGKLQPSIVAFPNPSPGVFHIHVPGLYDSYAFWVMDREGRVIARSNGSRTGDLNLDLGHLSPGIYFLHLLTHEGTAVQRLVRI